MRILVPLAEGFEEIETVTVVDVLRRAGLDVTLAGLVPGPCRGSRGVVVIADALLGDLDPMDFDALVLPGGMGGTLAMAEHTGLLEALRAFRQQDRWVAAICAATLVLDRAGVVDGIPVTAHPSVQGQLSGSVQPDSRVLCSGRVVTSQGPGTSIEFALELVGLWAGEAKRSELEQAMVVLPSSAR